MYLLQKETHVNLAGFNENSEIVTVVAIALIDL